MTRTIISLSEEDKHWLDAYSKQAKMPVSKVIRAAISEFKRDKQAATHKHLLSQTAGVWRNKKMDALRYVEALRKEW